MKAGSLPAEHYAAGWSTETVRSHGEINALGKRYAEKHDRDALLELCQAFHPYLMKYLVMICRGDGCEFLLLEEWFIRLSLCARLPTWATWPKFSDQGSKSVVVKVGLVSEFAALDPRLDFLDQPLEFP